MFALSHTQIYSEEIRQKLRSTLIDWIALFIGATVREERKTNCENRKTCPTASANF